MVGRSEGFAAGVQKRNVTVLEMRVQWHSSSCEMRCVLETEHFRYVQQCEITSMQANCTWRQYFCEKCYSPLWNTPWCELDHCRSFLVGKIFCISGSK